MTIGQRLKQARLEAGLSQRQLCGEVITRNMLSQIENGAAKPSMDTLRYLAGQLQKPIGYFLGEDAILDPGQKALEAARNAYQTGDFAGVLKLLGADADWERGLLRALSCLALAEEALREGRMPYARKLLSDCAAVGKDNPYYTPELERRRLLLLAQAQPELLSRVVTELPSLDEELLLRSRHALDQKDAARAAAMLDSVSLQEDPRWLLLRGEAAFAQEDFLGATRYFHRVEAFGDSRADAWLEQCYRQMEDYKMAYHYACKQK